jgi:NAD(P)-dependent dehydrogenase (short-subunit alcohol dehydrogenase family)
LIVKTPATAGHHVYATMRNIDSSNAPEAAACAIKAQLALDVIELDVTSDTSVNTAVQQRPTSTWSSTTPRQRRRSTRSLLHGQIDALFNLNAFGPIRVCKAVLPRMRARRSGLLIFVTSISAASCPAAADSTRQRSGCRRPRRIAPYQVAPLTSTPSSSPGSFLRPPTARPARRPSHRRLRSRHAAPEPATPASYVPPDPQEIADAVKRLVDTPHGQRPLRTVVGPVFTEGVAEYNALYEQHRARLADSLRRPDQADHVVAAARTACLTHDPLWPAPRETVNRQFPIT